MSRVVLVTGGTRGIGAEIAKAFHQKGYKVAATYGDNAEAARVFEEDTGVRTYRWDVSVHKACLEGISKIVKDLGNIDVLVNNAGITKDMMFHKMDYAAWRQVLSVNLDSLFNMTSCVIEPMRAQGFGRIINISSINGLKGQVGQVNYSTAKAGVLGFTKALALETARKGITVNAIAPGYINTEMVANIPTDVLEKIVAQIPAGRLGKPEEVANLALYLASDEAAFITGATLNANGGQYCQ